MRFWFVAAFLLACTAGEAMENPMPRDTGETLGPNDPYLLNMKRAWSASGKLRTQVGVDSVSMQAVFPRAENYTVQFALTFDPLLTGSGVKADAEISWSVEGNTVTRRVSVGNGVSVTGVGQGVRVVIKDSSHTSTAAGVEYNVAVTVAPGVRGDIETPPTFVPTTSPSDSIIANLGIFSVPVPVNAGAVSVYVSIGRSPGGAPIPDQSVIVTQRSGPGAPGIRKRYDPRNFQWVTLEPSVTSVEVNNNSGASINFTMTFGIDG